MRLLYALPLIAACSGSDASDGVVGPFTGTTRRFTIDSFSFPTTNTEARAMGADLNGDKLVDNQIGQVTATLTSQNDITPFASSMFAAGVLPSAILIQANDFTNDDVVGVTYLGKPGDTGIPAGGTFNDGVFASNRSSSAHPTEGSLVLPIFADADPLTLRLDHGEIDLTPDGTGYSGHIRGAIADDVAKAAAADGITQMVMSNPQDHAGFGIVMDKDRDGRVTRDEVIANDLVSSLLAPDLHDNFISIGFTIHISPCDAGTCAPTTIPDACHDRVLDGDETDVDCGGSCTACGFDAACNVGPDCQSGTCAAGTCRAPTCSDLVQDGFESGVDCGTLQCGSCEGGFCNTADDCHAGTCVDGKCHS